MYFSEESCTSANNILTIEMEDYWQDTEDYNFTGVVWEQEDMNTSSICAVESLESIDGSVVPSSLFTTIRVLRALYICILMVLGLISNFFVICLVFKYKKLQTCSFIVAVQIALANIIVLISNGLPSIVNSFAGRWILGLEICIISGFTQLLVINLRTILVFAFSIDRFSSVFLPFTYPKYSRKIVTIMCVLAWAISCSLSLLMTPQLLDCYIYSLPASSCVFSSRCSGTCRMSSLIYSATIVIPTTIIPIGLFTALYFKGRKIRRNEAMLRDLSDAEVSDWRAIKTFSLIFVTIFVLTIPPTVIAQITALFGSMVRTLLLIASASMSYAIVVTDPIMILRNKDVRDILSEIKKQWLESYRIRTTNRIKNASNDQCPSRPEPVERE